MFVLRLVPVGLKSSFFSSEKLRIKFGQCLGLYLRNMEDNSADILTLHREEGHGFTQKPAFRI